MKIEHFLMPYKNKFKMIKNSNLIPEIIKLSEENIGIHSLT